MANRRMFSKTVVCSSKFLRMPATSRLLYYDLGMASDDDGYCEWFPVLQMTGAKEQDMEVLHANGLVFVFDKEVLVVKDWKENNFIRSDRYQPSKYVGRYENMLGLPLGIPTVDPGKDRLGEDTTVVAIAPQEFDIVQEGESSAPVRQKKNTPEMLEGYKIFDDNPARATFYMKEIERESIRVLLETYGHAELVSRYQVIKSHRGERGCPDIHSPSTMLEKMPKMEYFLTNV